MIYECGCTCSCVCRKMCVFGVWAGTHKVWKTSLCVDCLWDKVWSSLVSLDWQPGESRRFVCSCLSAWGWLAPSAMPSFVPWVQEPNSDPSTAKLARGYQHTISQSPRWLLYIAILVLGLYCMCLLMCTTKINSNCVFRKEFVFYLKINFQ